MPLSLLNVHRNYLVNLKILQLLNDIPIPDIAECCWNFPCPSLSDPEAELKAQLDKSSLARAIKPGSRIAITAGSRGISHIATILARICEEVKKLHAHPVVVSAMGSHGGATEEGQREILKNYGITPERVGAPVICSVNAVEVGKTADGMPVFIDAEAFPFRRHNCGQPGEIPYQLSGSYGKRYSEDARGWSWKSNRAPGIFISLARGV